LENVGVSLSQIDVTTRQKFTGLSEDEVHSYAETYALVVIDEAHEGFLRKNNKAYQNMQAMVFYARDTQSRTIRGLLLTATPWNNSREDVIRLGLLFLNIQKIDEILKKTESKAVIEKREALEKQQAIWDAEIQQFTDENNERQETLACINQEIAVLTSYIIPFLPKKKLNK